MTCSPPFDRPVPAKEKSAAEPYAAVKVDWSEVRAIRSPPVRTVPAGNARSGVASVMPAENDQPEMSTGAPPLLVSSRNSTAGEASGEW